MTITLKFRAGDEESVRFEKATKLDDVFSTIKRRTA